MDASTHPELAKALAVQARYMELSGGKSADNRNNLLRRLGTLAGAIYKDEKILFQSTPQPEKIRVFTFYHQDNYVIKPAELPPPPTSAADEALPVPFSLPSPWLTRPEFSMTDTTWLVGYDIETQSYDDGRYDEEKDEFVQRTPAHCVSHQWYFNFQGVRFGFILLTDLRISQFDFVTFLKGAIPDIKDPEILSTVKVFAHFSLYESGWMHASPASKKPGTSKKPAFSLLINERNDEWYGTAELWTYTLPPSNTPTGRKSTAKPKQYTVRLEFCDSIKLQNSSLEKLGENIGIEKAKLDEGIIKEVAKFLKSNPKSFCEYAIIDAIITAEAHLYFFYKYKTCMLPPEEQEDAKDHPRMPGYSNEYFRNLYKKKYGKRWKVYLGYNSSGMTLVHKAFVHFFHGGRNDVLSVGPRGEAHYLDLHSAYLTSVVMLNDYDFSKTRVTTGAAAEERLEQLYEKGPFQVVGIECSFRFNDAVNGRIVKPIFPVRIDEAESLPGVRINFNSDGIIYPKSGKSNLTMPEYWVARHNGLIDKLIVHRVIEFKDLDTHWLSDEILRLLKLRKDSNESDKLYYKNILNFFFGKTAQGVKAAAAAIKAHDLDKRVNASSMTCYPLASYITGFCRATVGELLQNNPCYGITTDGFITPVSREKLVIHDGDLSDHVQKKLASGGFHKNFIGCDASGSRSLFLKTRGYLLAASNETNSPNDSTKRSEKLQKMAAMGIKIDKKNSPDPVRDFLEALKKGYADKEHFVKLNKIREEQKKNPAAAPEKRIQKNVKADRSFDMKHLPVNPVTENFEWAGKQYSFTSFETAPLDTATDFHILRALRGRDNERDLPKALNDPNFAYTDIPEWAYNTEDDSESDNNSKVTTIPKPEDQKTASPEQSTEKQKIKTKVIDGVSKPQTIDYNVKTSPKSIIELQLRACQIPTYMEEPDYERMLKKFDEFRNGTGSLEQLNSSVIDYNDLCDDETDGENRDWQDDES
jgi:hypothetical protein